MLKLAVTGGIACGKSLVGSFLSGGGIPVRDADDLAHALIERESPAHGEIVRAFGASVLDSKGNIDRKALGGIVFADVDKLALLNSIVHPPVRNAWQAWLRECSESGCGMAAVIVPLLYETGDARNWDAVVCVAAREEDQRSRLRDRGLSELEIGARMAAQMSVAEKMMQADYVIFNSGRIEMAEEQTTRVLRNMLEKQYARER